MRAAPNIIRASGAARALAGLLLNLLLVLTSNEAVAGEEAFLRRTYTNAARQTLPYRLLPPLHYDTNKSYPAILYLHGAAGRGDDNAKPLEWGPLLIGDDSVRSNHGFFLVIPQAPRSGGWTESTVIAEAKESPSLRLAIELVGEVLPKEFNLDSKRRYLTGVSMGGHAVWRVMVQRPGFFAAAVPVCSGGEAGGVTKAAAKFPVWAFHSDDDHLVPVQQARDLVKAWRALGGTAKYTEYTGLKHSSWKKAYVELGMYDWLFSQRLP